LSHLELNFCAFHRHHTEPPSRLDSSDLGQDVVSAAYDFAERAMKSGEVASLGDYRIVPVKGLESSRRVVAMALAHRTRST
jgi:hypothetical protein